MEVDRHQRFPMGVKYVADYIHERGLKFGIYQDCGKLTCQGYPGSFVRRPPLSLPSPTLLPSSSCPALVSRVGLGHAERFNSER
jgi:hypothetical protein